MAAEKKFKVCLVSISLAKGGLERSCAMLSEMLEAYGHEVHLVILNDEVDYPYSWKNAEFGKNENRKRLDGEAIVAFSEISKLFKKGKL